MFLRPVNSPHVHVRRTASSHPFSKTHTDPERAPGTHAPARRAKLTETWASSHQGYWGPRWPRWTVTGWTESRLCSAGSLGEEGMGSSLPKVPLPPQGWGGGCLTWQVVEGTWGQPHLRPSPCALPLRQTSPLPMGEGAVPRSLGGSPPPRKLLLLNIPERASRPLSSRENAGPALPSMAYPTVAPTSLWKSRHGQPPKTPLAPCTHRGLSKPLTGALGRHHP